MDIPHQRSTFLSRNADAIGNVSKRGISFLKRCEIGKLHTFLKIPHSAHNRGLWSLQKVAEIASSFIITTIASAAMKISSSFNISLPETKLALKIKSEKFVFPIGKVVIMSLLVPAVHILLPTNYCGIWMVYSKRIRAFHDDDYSLER